MGKRAMKGEEKEKINKRGRKEGRKGGITKIKERTETPSWSRNKERNMVWDEEKKRERRKNKEMEKMFKHIQNNRNTQKKYK